MLNGFSARLDPTSLALLDRDREVAGVYPVRIAYPAQARRVDGGVLPSAVADLEIAGLDGSGVTVALLDTGVDPSHPYLRRRVLSGVDVIDPGSGGVAQPHPTIPGRPERHATELAGIIAGTEGPDGLHGIAPGASILPVRVGGWQPNAEGGYSVYSRTDQILAGLEAAVDPNDDGDMLDAARIALIGMVEPYAAFADGPLPARSPARRTSTCSRSSRPGTTAGGARLREHRRARRRASTRVTVGCRRRPPRRADRSCPRARRPACPLRGRRPARRRTDGDRDRRRRPRRSPHGQRAASPASSPRTA